MCLGTQKRPVLLIQDVRGEGEERLEIGGGLGWGRPEPGVLYNQLGVFKLSLWGIFLNCMENGY